MGGLSFGVSQLLVTALAGVSWGLPFFLVFYILADLPAPQVQRVWNKALNAFKKPFFDASSLFGKDDEKQLEKKEIEKEKYRIFCSRLDKKISYEELEAKGKTQFAIACTIGGIIFFYGLTKADMVLLLVGAFMLIFGVVALRLPFMNIESEIKKLDKAIIFEAPIFINNIRVMNTKYTLEKVLDSYLQHAGAMHKDVELTLASLKNKTNVKALIEMSNRMQRGQRLEEVSSMVDLMKSLYSGTDVERCCINLELLANQINEIHVKPYIETRKDKKIMVMQFCVFAMVMIVFLLYISPMIIEMTMTLTEINS